ncbi:MAG: M1 family metallopeptidase [Bacteroidia bacterium]|nr:M1 family metallopeptidase [Bacteroidia bacterium]
MENLHAFVKRFVFLGLLLLALGDVRACGARSPYFGEGAQVLQGHSYANDREFVIKHIDMYLKVNFTDKTIEGWVEYDLVHAYLLDNRKPGSVPPYHFNPITGNHILLLDHRDMDVLGVYGGGAYDKKTGTLKSKAKKLTYSVGVGTADSLLFGKPLEIEVPRSQSKIVIHYKTRPSAGALQWLSPAQTFDQTHPFLFSQSQAILARTWIPLQDKPSVRFTYSAEVKVVCAAAGGATVDANGHRTGREDCIGVEDPDINPTDFNVVMSAVKLGNPEGDLILNNKVHRFQQKKPIPSYLMAIAVGSFGYKSLGKNTGVYAEHKLLDKAVWEFADLQKMVDAASDMFGEYAWGDYNVLVLPPSFPFGGMENPVVTFATPTIIAGDRSLVSLLAHELAHSWSGNLVTNRTWDDFWLNEGFTVYVESRIMERLYGADYADMLRVLGKGELDKTLGWMMKESPDDSHLRLHLGDRDPDEGLTDIAYEKGRFFLMMLEQLYGRKAFDELLNHHFKRYAFGTVTTDLFLADLKAFHEKNAQTLGVMLWSNFEPLVAAWIDGGGLPAPGVGGFPKLESKAFQRVEQQVSNFLVSGEPLHRGYSVPCDASVIDTTGFTTHHWLHLLRQLHTRADGSPGRLSRDEMAGLDARFGFTQTQNAEIACDWFVLAIQSDYRPAYQAMHDFLLKVGRRKFLMPIYEASLAQYVVRDGKYEHAFVQGKEMATEIFLQAEPGYHSVAARSLRELLGLPLSGGSGR